MVKGRSSDELKTLVEQLKQHGFVADLHVESDGGVGFSIDPLTLGAATLVIVFSRFGEALIGRAADDFWSLIGRLVRKLWRRLPAGAKPGERRLCVKYVAEVGGRNVELVLRYDSLRKLRSDVRNHRHYAALALGWASAGDTVPGAEQDLLPLLTPELAGHLEELTVRER